MESRNDEEELGVGVWRGDQTRRLKKKKTEYMVEDCGGGDKNICAAFSRSLLPLKRNQPHLPNLTR